MRRKKIVVAKKKTERDDLMLRTRAVKCLGDSMSSVKQQAEVGVSGFLAIFHPEMDEKKRREIALDIGENTRR